MKATIFPHADHEREQVIVTTGTHPIVYATAMTFAALAVAAAAHGAVRFIASDAALAWISLGLAGILAVLAGWTALVAYLRYRGTRILVTTHGVTRLIKRPFSLNKRQIYFHSIEEAEVRQGILGLLFNYGTLILHLSDKSIEYKAITNPQKIAEEIAAHLGHEHGQGHLVEAT